MEECCLNYGGDGADNEIRFEVGHHPACSKFKEIFGDIPTYHYKVNVANMIRFLKVEMSVRPEHLLVTAKEFMNILEKTEGESIYLASFNVR